MFRKQFIPSFKPQLCRLSFHQRSPKNLSFKQGYGTFYLDADASEIRIKYTFLALVTAGKAWVPICCGNIQRSHFLLLQRSCTVHIIPYFLTSRAFLPPHLTSQHFTKPIFLLRNRTCKKHMMCRKDKTKHGIYMGWCYTPNREEV